MRVQRRAQRYQRTLINFAPLSGFLFLLFASTSADIIGEHVQIVAEISPRVVPIVWICSAVPRKISR